MKEREEQEKKIITGIENMQKICTYPKCKKDCFLSEMCYKYFDEAPRFWNMKKDG